MFQILIGWPTKYHKAAFIGTLFMIASCDFYDKNQEVSCPIQETLNPLELTLECKQAVCESIQCEPQIEPVTPETINNYFTQLDCSDSGQFVYAWQTNWCIGKKAWQKSGKQTTINTFQFVNAWQYGVLSELTPLNTRAIANRLEQISQSNSPQTGKKTTNKQRKEAFLLGKKEAWYRSGVRVHVCNKNKPATAYDVMWCEAAEDYKHHTLYNSKSLALQQQYINGFIAGSAVALAQPNSLDSLLKDHSHDKILSSRNRKGGVITSDRYFESGYQSGYTATIEALKSSVSEALQDLDLPVDKASFQLPVK